MDRAPAVLDRNQTTEKADMTAFREKVAKLILDRKAGGGMVRLNEIIDSIPSGLSAEERKAIITEQYGAPIDMPDLMSINPEQLINLTEEDAIMLDEAENYKLGSVTLEDIKNYRKKVAVSKNPVRIAFASAVINKLQDVILLETEKILARNEK